jgi:adenosylcobinamide-GDP ribazoletransferase
MNSLWIAFSTLTLLPVSTANPTPKDLKQSVLWYPLIGAVIGGGLWVIHLLRISTDLQALLTLFFWIGITGAFHLDGLGDCLDGFFGGKTPQDRQRIMKSADLGTYGITGIGLTLIAKYVLLSHLMAQNNVGPWLIAIPLTARWAVSLSCLISKAPLGNKGLGSFVMGLNPSYFLFATLFLIAGCSALKWPAIGMVLIASGVSLAISRLSTMKIGGLTGDGLGATIEITEITLLFYACLNTYRISL